MGKGRVQFRDLSRRPPLIFFLLPFKTGQPSSTLRMIMDGLLLDIGLRHFLFVSLIVFVLGLYCVLTRKNAIGILLGVELILNSANINYIAFSHFSSGNYDGQVFAIFVIMLAAAEAVIGLAIVLGIYQNFSSIDIEAVDSLQG